MMCGPIYIINITIRGCKLFALYLYKVEARALSSQNLDLETIVVELLALLRDATILADDVTR